MRIPKEIKSIIRNYIEDMKLHEYQQKLVRKISLRHLKEIDDKFLEGVLSVLPPTIQQVVYNHYQDKGPEHNSLLGRALEAAVVCKHLTRDDIRKLCDRFSFVHDKTVFGIFSKRLFEVAMKRARLWNSVPNFDYTLYFQDNSNFFNTINYVHGKSGTEWNEIDIACSI